MMQATDFADWHDFAELGWLDRPAVRCIFGEGKVGSGAVVIREIASQDVTQVALAQDDDVVETVAANRADQAFGKRILPRTLGSREDFSDLHALHALAEHVSVNRVAIAKEIGRGGVVGEGVHDLLSGPRRGGMLGDVAVQDPTPTRNVRQVCEGGRFGMRRETVRSASSIPSLHSSPWIRGAPQSGLAAAILRTTAMISALTEGRPTLGLLESLAQ
jgi:hypothetical protein